MPFVLIEKDLEGLVHCDLGPAVCREVIGQPSFHKEWWQHGKLHRVEGPAIEYADGEKHWFYENQFIDCESQKEFEKYIKNRAFW